MPRPASSLHCRLQPAVGSAASCRIAQPAGCPSTPTPKPWPCCAVKSCTGVTTRLASKVALDRLLSTPTRRVSVRPLIPEAWRWRANLTMADALYVIVAQHVGCELVTVDLRLAHRPKVLRSPALWYGLRLVSSLVGPYSVAHPVRFASRSLSEHGSAALGSPPAAPGPP